MSPVAVLAVELERRIGTPAELEEVRAGPGRNEDRAPSPDPAPDRTHGPAHRQAGGDQ